MTDDRPFGPIADGAAECWIGSEPWGNRQKIDSRKREQHLAPGKLRRCTLIVIVDTIAAGVNDKRLAVEKFLNLEGVREVLEGLSR